MSVQIEAVTVEHHESGFGMGHASPRISWRYGSTTTKDWRQTGYEIEVTRGSTGGKPTSVKGSCSTLVPWPSAPLKSREKAKIRVRAQGSDGKWTEWSELDIEAGLLDRSDWKAKMISGPPAKKELPKPPFQLVKRFALDKVSNARVYATAHGIYELEINGQVVGDQVLAPGWTSYSHHLNYQTYDVTSLLKSGENVIGAHVGEGWYAGRLGKVESNQFGDRLGFFGQLEVDGKVVVATDDSWQSAPSAWTEGGLYDGATLDSTKEDKKWATAESKTKFSSGVEVLDDPKAELCSSDSPPIRRKIEIKAKEIITTPSGKKVLDFGQNLVGWLRLNENVKGDKLVIRHAEVLEDGEMGMRPLRSAKATDTITLGGDVKGWEPKFTFHGFRYAEVSGMDDSLSLGTFTAVVVFSDMRPTGTFDSSHQGLNQLHANTIWGTRGNFVSVPTDCPQRDERLGWTGDIQVFSPTANYLYDTSGFLSAWMRDVSAETFDHKGVVPVTVPYSDDHGARPNAPQAAWADCIAMTPWDLYESTSDPKILEDSFEAMKLWLDKGLPRGENGLWEPNLKRSLYADWLDPEAPPAFPSHGRTDTHFVANAYLVHVTGLVVRIANVLGHKSDATRFEKQHQDLLATFKDEYVTPSGRVAADTQTAFALALQFGLLDEKQAVHAADRLDYLIRWNWFKISTGFAGTPILLPVLAKNGKLESAYRMLQEKDCPSWLYPVTMGATTIWERWDSMLPNGKINPGQMTSFNHYAYGSVCAFLHATVAGLSPLEPGWTKALIRPQPGGTVTHASTTYSSPIGTYAVKWQLKGGKLSVEVEVPPNGSAKVVLPGVEEEIGSGKKNYTVDWKRSGEWPPKGIKGPQSQPHADNFME